MPKKILTAAVSILLFIVVAAAATIFFLPGLTPLPTSFGFLSLGGVPGGPATPGGGVGFFSPGGIPDAVIRKTQFGVINASTPAQIEESFEQVSGSAFKVSVDLGPVISPATDPAKLNIRYTSPNGLILTKTFAPQEQNKLRAIPPDPELRKQMAPFLDVLARYSSNVGAIFLVDEPYLNGITKAEMERTAKVARQELAARGLGQVKIGVIFASGMFDRQFAHMIDKRSGAYVNAIDEHYAKGDPANPGDFQSWVSIIKTNRLATYDRAGNLYVDGGLPRGLDVYGFDFYLSTILLDSLHEHTLEWLAERYPQQFGCGQFADQSMSKIRSRLSFFQNGSVLQGEQPRIEDRKVLDAIFECRMGAVTAMLKNASGSSAAQFLMISESSNNGAFEFDPSGNIKQGQPDLLVESRVLDEVERAQSFYARNANTYSAGLMYFTYQNEYDHSIKLHIGGASTMPSVLASIYKFAAEAPKLH